MFQFLSLPTRCRRIFKRTRYCLSILLATTLVMGIIIVFHLWKTVDNSPIAVVVIAALRPAAIENHLTQILRYRPDPSLFPVIVSQDWNHKAVTNVIRHFILHENQVYTIQHPRSPGLQSSQPNSYKAIAQHYKFALDEVFLKRGYKTAIITEDDLDIAKDFFSYFQSTRHLLFEDPSIWCISAWNDNGSPSLVDHDHSEQLYRTDFFPGLGWMLSAETWKELSPIWPDAYWDDFLRLPEIRKNRVCVRPEMSRTAHNMKLAGKGASNGLYKNFLSSIKLPDKPIDFLTVNLDRLMKPTYDSELDRALRASKIVSLEDLINNTSQTITNKDVSYRVVYQNPREFRRFANKFCLMFDIRGGAARTAYLGVITFTFDGVRIYALHGAMNFKKPVGTQLSSEIYSDDWTKKSQYLD